jgi:hypothetical protein
MDGNTPLESWLKTLPFLMAFCLHKLSLNPEPAQTGIVFQPGKELTGQIWMDLIDVESTSMIF